jgi:hypothetical protein
MRSHLEPDAEHVANVSDIGLAMLSDDHILSHHQPKCINHMSADVVVAGQT